MSINAVFIDPIGGGEIEVELEARTVEDALTGVCRSARSNVVLEGTRGVWTLGEIGTGERRTLVNISLAHLIRFEAE